MNKGNVQTARHEHKPDPKVSFITVCYKTPHLIRLLLQGMEAADLKFPFEYILVDNNPGDGTGEMVRKRFPWVQVIDAPKNRGFGAGCNLGLRRMRGEFAMLTNPDLVVFPGEMEKLVKFLDDHPDVGFAGPALFNPDQSRQYSCYRFPSMMIPVYRRTFLGKTPWGKRAVNHYLMHEEIQKNQPIETDALMGSAILMRRRSLDDIGLFDEKFFMYFEEVDICRRAWKLNWRVIYVPEVKLVHYHQRESLTRWPWQIITHKLTRAHIRSAVYYFWKYRNQKHPHLEHRPVL
ncbi:MAG: glycosyltransferase family 2 protein [Patescibacteria group bacterium]